MSGEFTDDAKAMWGAIPQNVQEQLLKNVWCVHCKSATTITDFTGEMEKGDLILRGLCINCGGGVA